MTRFLLVLACCAALLLIPAAAQAIAPGEALRLLNAQRAANGIPGDLVEAPGLTDGCAKHGNYLALNGGALTQGEDPAKPGYTPEGDRQTLASSGPQALSSDARWSDTASPWLLQPISLYRLFDPEIAAAGYSDANAIACMRVAGGRAPATAPELYSVPANGRIGVPHTELNREPPYTPQQLVGLPADQPTGPNILLFTRGLRGSAPLAASAFSLTGPAGPVDARLVTEATKSDAGSGAWFRGGGVLVPAAPLAPFTTYVARVAWHRDAEGELPAADVEQVVGFESAGLANTIDVTVTTTGAVNVIRVSTPAPNPTLTLNGPGSLTDIAKLTDGVARYDDLDPGSVAGVREVRRQGRRLLPRLGLQAVSGSRQGAHRAAAGPRRVERPGVGPAGRRWPPRPGDDLALPAAVPHGRRAQEVHAPDGRSRAALAGDAPLAGDPLEAAGAQARRQGHGAHRPAGVQGRRRPLPPSRGPPHLGVTGAYAGGAALQPRRTAAAVTHARKR